MREHDAAAFKQFQVHQQCVPHEMLPLDVPATNSTVAMTSHKAPWDIAHATLSLSATGMYEASGNVMWLNPFRANH